MAVVVEELLQHVQHAGHLGEDEDAVTALLQLPQQGVEGLQLSYTHTHTHITDYQFCLGFSFNSDFSTAEHLTVI